MCGKKSLWKDIKNNSSTQRHENSTHTVGRCFWKCTWAQWSTFSWRMLVHMMKMALNLIKYLNDMVQKLRYQIHSDKSLCQSNWMCIYVEKRLLARDMLPQTWSNYVVDTNKLKPMKFFIDFNWIQTFAVVPLTNYNQYLVSNHCRLMTFISKAFSHGVHSFDYTMP